MNCKDIEKIMWYLIKQVQNLLLIRLESQLYKGDNIDFIDLLIVDYNLLLMSPKNAYKQNYRE